MVKCLPLILCFFFSLIVSVHIIPFIMSIFLWIYEQNTSSASMISVKIHCDKYSDCFLYAIVSSASLA